MYWCRKHARGAALAASLDRNLRLMRRSGRLEQLIAEAHLERSGQTRTLAVDPLTGQTDQQRSPGQEQDQGQHAPLQPAWREDPLGMR